MKNNIYEQGGHISQWAASMRDVLEAKNSKHLWLTSSWRDIKLRYTNSILGPLWITASMGVFITCFSVVGATLFSIDIRDYLPFLTIGIITWMYMSTVLVEGADIFISHAHLILNQRSPYTAWIMRLFLRSIIIFLHNFLIFILVAIVLKIEISVYTLMFIPGFIILTLTLIGASLTISVLATKYRDIPPLLGSIIQVCFFLTPVMWDPSIIEKAGKRYILDFNPLHHLLSIVRNPLINEPVSISSYTTSIILALACLIVGWVVFTKSRSKIAYYL